MADIHNLDDQRKKDTLTAHIALGAEEAEEGVGDCLTPEQLTDIAVGGCTAEEKERALAHFSNCKKCYDAWVAISFSIAAVHRGSSRPTRSFGTVRNLTFLGSAFAIAASVVVFLNLKDGPLVQQVASPPAMEQAPAPAPAPASTRPSPGVKAQAGRQSEPTMILMHADEEAGTGAQMATGGSGPEENELLQLSEPVSVAQWLAIVKEACMQPGQREPLLWESLAEQGANLDIPEGSVPIKEKIKFISALLTAAGHSSAEQHCPSILALLAEEGVKE